MTDFDIRMRRFMTKIGDEDGVFSRGLAIEYGISDWHLRKGLAAGEWTRFAGVYLLAGAADTPPARLRAAVQRGGSNAAGTGATALRFYGLEVPTRDLCIAVPAKHHAQVPDVTVLRDLDKSESLTTRRGLALVSQERALLDALRTLPISSARQLMFSALQGRWTAADRINSWVETHPGCRGNRQLRELAALAASGSHSEGECLLAELMHAAGISGWAANKRIYDADGLAGIADFCFEEQRVIIEFDGYAWHSDHEKFEHDRVRQNRLIGWKILRFTWTHLTQNPDYVIRAIKEALG